MNFTPLNADLETQKGAVEGQGSAKNPLQPRGLNRDKVSTPDQTSFDKIREKPELYARVVTPQEVEQSRVIFQITGSESSDPISSQLNNKINPTMDNFGVRGGTRKSI